MFAQTGKQFRAGTEILVHHHLAISEWVHVAHPVILLGMMQVCIMQKAIMRERGVTTLPGLRISQMGLERNC